MSGARARKPSWQRVVLTIALTGATAVAAAAAALARHGVSRPWIAVGGIVATIAVNRIYVVVARRGEVLEGIDIAEAPIVALALLLPPAEALLAFVTGSAILECCFRRAPAKKVFNVGVRATSAGLLVLPIAAAGTPTGVARYAVTLLGALLYTTASSIAVAAIASSLTTERMLAVARKDVGARAVVWGAAVTTGAAAAYAGSQRPLALVALASLVVLISLSAHAARRAQRETERLKNVLAANTKIQTISGRAEQEAVLTDIANSLLPWKDVAIRDEPPAEHERGVSLREWDGTPRWFVATPRAGSDPWSSEDVRVVETLGGAAQTAFERLRLQAELSRQARIDPLTGVANRREFDEALEQLARNANRRFGVLVVDLDGFKDINDHLGHATGDEVLRIAAARLSGAVRGDDLVARIGGDEFAVLVADVTSAETLESMRAAIQARFAEPVAIGGWQLPELPASIGIGCASETCRSAAGVLRVADESMYRSKRAARPQPTPAELSVPRPRAEMQERIIRLRLSMMAAQEGSR